MAEVVKEEPADFDEIIGPVVPEYYSITDNNDEDEDSKCDINLGEISSTDTDGKVDVKHDTEYYKQFLDKESWDAGEGTSKQSDSDVKPSGLVESIKEELDSDNSDMEAENDDENEDSKSIFEEQLHEIEGTACDEDGQQRSSCSSTDDEDHTYAAGDSEHQQCKLCDYKHHKVSKLRRHIEKIHQNMTEIKCKLCDYRTFQILEMESHVNERHPNQSRHKCVVCDASFVSMYNLHRHVKFAHKLPQNKCQFCDRYEDNGAKLKRHVEKYHFKSIMCEHCGYSASQRCDMVKHIARMHVGIKRFKCKDCNYAAVFERDLRNHFERKHVRVKCDICDITTDKKSLVQHKLSVHNSFAVKLPNNNTEYRRHVSNHCNDAVIRCKICDFRAESRLWLNKHIKIVHQGCIEH